MVDYLLSERIHEIINKDELEKLRSRLVKLFYILGKEEIAVVTCSQETAMLLYLFRKELKIENEIELEDGNYYLSELPIEIDEYIEFGKVVTGYELL
jgi:hypothetical protein